MDGREDLDLYRPTRRIDRSAALRGVARALGILAGSLVTAYGLALYVLRCFDTCPTDPAEDKVGRLLTAAIVLGGLALVTGAASAATRWARAGYGIVAAMGAAIAACGAVSLALIPSIEAPGDHSGSTKVALAAIVVGALSAAAALALRRRRSAPAS